ncbi:MAG: YncE family protein [Verrucomicrobiota bacterium]|nr:YncE family protein [Verrucomicrobiota bacterium]
MRLRNLILASALILQTVAAQEYRALPEIPIGGEGGWDTLSVAAHRLYLSHATKVVVVDLEKNAVAGEITDTPGVHAFIAVPGLNRGFSSNGKEAKASVVDLKTLATTAKIDTGEGPDAMAYDAARVELYVFNHRGGSATVIDARSEKVVSTITLGGSPEFGVADAAAGRVYVNLEDKSEVAVIDTAKHEVIAHWPLAPGAEPTGIALDARTHRLFCACNNKLVVMLDAESGKVMSTAPVGEHVDGCAFDAASRLVFVSFGEGVANIVKEETPEKLTPAQTLTTERGARTIALDPATHRIYLPTAKFQPAPSPAPDEKPARPATVPNTLKLLVYGPAEKCRS